MSLLERSGALAVTARDLKGLREVANQAAALRSRTGIIVGDLDRLKIANARRRLLNGHRIPVPVRAETALGIASFARDLSAKVAQAPGVVLSPDLHVGPRLNAPLKGFVKELEDAVAASWRDHVLSLAPRIRADLLDVMGRVPGLKTDVDTVRGLFRRLAEVSERVPSSDEDIRMALIVADRLHAAWRALDAADMPVEVLAFLREAAAPGGADLTRLTEAVLAWLSAHGLTASFKVATR